MGIAPLPAVAITPSRLPSSAYPAASSRSIPPTILINIRLPANIQYVKFGAGDGNRTHATSLEGWGSTVELHPRNAPDKQSAYREQNGAEDGI